MKPRAWNTALALLWQITRGLLEVIVVAWLVATLTFVLMRNIPGGPFSSERQLPESVRKIVEDRYRLNDPLSTQYFRYLADAARGDFGVSYNDHGRSVGEIIAERAPRSALLGVIALGLALAIAFPLGVTAAVERGRWPDRLNAFVASAGVSVPSFILGALLLFVFAYKLRWFPATGWRFPESLVLPSIALAVLPTAYLARLIRGELIEVLRSDFLRTARAKGLSWRRVVLVHALRHTLAPVFAYLGPQAAAIMTGSFVVERIYSIPGLGEHYVTSISNRNYPMIMGVTLTFTVLLVVFNLLSDAVARLLDPRMRERT